MRIRVAGSVLAVATLLLALAVPALAAPPEGLHCPDGWQDKDQSGADDNDLVVPEGTLFCVKAGSAESNESEQGNTGVITADGETTLCEYLIAAGIVGGGGDCRDVSYWVTYQPESQPDESIPDESIPDESIPDESLPGQPLGGGTPPVPPDTSSAPSQVPWTWAFVLLCALAGAGYAIAGERRRRGL